MIINAIRFRAPGQDEWQAYKLSLGAGRFRNYQCISAAPETLAALAAALNYGLTGQDSGGIEIALQLSDDAGHTWVLHRRPGSLKILKDGAALPPETAESDLASALMDLDGLGEAFGGALPQSVTLGRFHIKPGDDGLSLKPLGAPESPLETVKDVAARQIAEISSECARVLDLTALADPKTLTRLARRLEPLHAQYRELCRQYTELKEDATGFAEKDLPSMQTLADEIEVLAQLEEAAVPLLAPGVSLKALKDEQAKADADIAEICAALGIDNAEGRHMTRDFRKAIEALARLEAHAKLIRASQGARKYCEQKIEPLYKNYLATAGSGLICDRQIVSELESCLASLTLRLHPREDSTQPAGTTETGLKTWFDRFKSKNTDDSQAAAADMTQNATTDIETARMAIEYALNRLHEISASVVQATAKHESALGRVDEAHEELVRNFSRLRDHWLVVARACHLPDELDLNGLLRIAMHQGRLAGLVDLRQELAEKVRRYGQRLAKVEQLLLAWRQATGSQKSVDLANPTILLAETRDVLRYYEAKRKRFSQLRDAAGEAKAALTIRNLLKTRRKALMGAWNAAFASDGLAPLQIHDEKLDELFQRASLVKALALVHGSAGAQAQPRVFDAATEGTAATIYLWEETATDNKLRLAFLQQLEDASGGELRILLLADEGLTAMLAPLGVGMATKIAAKQPAAETVRQEAPRPAVQAPPRTVPAETPAAALARPGASPVVKAPVPKTESQQPPTAAILNDRARRALELLAVKKN